MREFKSIPAFLSFLSRIQSGFEYSAHRAVEAGARIILTEVKSEIGHYQSAIGPFDAWAPLSEATLGGFFHPLAGYIPGKIELGYQEDPLLRDGTLRDSYSMKAHGLSAEIGSPLDLAVWQELGTPDAMYPIPGRHVLGGSAFRKSEVAARTIGDHVFRALRGLPARND